MGYSSPKKQLDLNEFLAKPGVPRRNRNFWQRSAAPAGSKSKGSETKPAATPKKDGR